MVRIGITGSNGFLGWHLKSNLKILANHYDIIDFERSFFENEEKLHGFIKSCDIIVHFSGVNRHSNPSFIYETNLNITKKLALGLEKCNFKGKLFFSSSTQEDFNNPFGDSKKISRKILHDVCNKIGAIFFGLIIPNVFGPFGKPNYNSVVTTFSYNLINSIKCNVIQDRELELIYVDKLMSMLIKLFKKNNSNNKVIFRNLKKIKVSKILKILEKFNNDYYKNGTIPKLNTNFHLNLFNTFRSHIDLNQYFPKSYINNIDKRGNFIEILKSKNQGQVSFSTTEENVVRGNHFHTRKIERFSVIKGKAIIELRRIDSNEKIIFKVDGNSPSYIDMPIWYTHNIKNIGNDKLVTLFWINEFYDEKDPDTYFETV